MILSCFHQAIVKPANLALLSKMEEPNEPVELPITGELDLHTFRPNEISDLLPDYFAECRKRGILSVRVVHGKGTGTLRSGVHALLPTIKGVAEWTWPVALQHGGWGATWVRLKP